MKKNSPFTLKNFTKKTLLLVCFSFLSTYTLYPSYIKYVNNQPQTLHVFLDVSAGPTLLQMIQFVKLHPKDPKIIAWNIFPNIKNNTDLSKWNATEIEYTSQINISNIAQKAACETNYFLTQHPNTKIILHSNLYHTPSLTKSFVKNIKQHKIHHLFLYEDGHGNIISSQKERIIDFFSDSKSMPYDKVGFYAFKTYPTTYYVGYKNEIESDTRLKSLNELWKTNNIIDVNFNEIYKTLSKQNIQDITSLLNFDPDFYKNLYRSTSKPTAFLLTPRPTNKDEEKKQIHVLLDILKDETYFWILKPHPNPQSESITRSIKDIHPDIPLIPRNIPTELFLLTNALPDKIAGYSSSVFLSLNPQLFLWYIKRPKNDVYLPFLLEKEILLPQQIISLEETTP